MSELSLALLGSFEALHDGRALTHFRAKTAQALLIYLTCQPEPHPREQLMTLLWPGMPQPSAQQNLRQSLYLLRQAIPELVTKSGNGRVPFLLADRQTVQVNPDGRYHLDVTAFTQLLQQGEAHWPEAMSLYRGDFLADFYLPDSAPFEEWANSRRAELRRRCLDALATLTDHALQTGSLAEARDHARRQLEIDNLRESAYRQLMTALAVSDQRSEALGQYETCRRLLRDELGVEPSQPTRALYERIARGKGLEEGAAVPSEPGAARQITALERPRHNLPLQLSSFIGRAWEVAEVGRLLVTSRLVTLTGVGGSGKTRLALQAAAQVLDNFTDGVWLVELAPLSEAALLPQTVASALEIGQVADQPPLTLLLNYLRDRSLLMLLDNCEHLVEAAAQLADTLLRQCPHLHILATSREALNISGETAWLVPSLSLPEPGEQPPLATLQQADAVCLFVERATAVLPSFHLTEQNAAVVAQVCRRLDGLPLALELAAARVKLLRVEQIAARLDDRFRLLAGRSRTVLPRHQTLGALIDWSYDLLTPAEQRLLHWLSVFAGGFTLEAVEAVCADNVRSGRSVTEPGGTGRSGDRWRPVTPEGEVLELLAQLVNKSLVVAQRETGQEARYHLLETIRQYAWAKLVEGGEAEAAQSQHLAYFLQLAETAEPELHRADQLLWLDRLEAENDNLRVALAWSLENSNRSLESGLRLATVLVEFWLLHSYLREGSRWLDMALDKRNSAAPPIRARLLLKAGWLWTKLSVWVRGPTVLLQESLALYRQMDDKRGVAWCLHCLAIHARAEGDVVVATSLLSESLTLAGQFDDKLLLTGLYFEQAFLAMLEGDYVQATELATSGLVVAQETGDRQMKFYLLALRNGSAQRQRDYAGAMAFLHEAQTLARELKNRGSEGGMLIELGEVARHQRAYEQAVVFYHQSLVLYREIGSMEGIVVVLLNLGLVALGQGDQPRATSLFRESLMLSQESKLKRLNWWNVGGLARVALAEGQTRRAVQLFATDGLLAELRRESPVDFDDFERDVALARTQLGEEAFAAAWAAGQAMSLDEAVALALQES